MVYYKSIDFKKLAISFLLFYTISCFVLNPESQASKIDPQADFYRSKGLEAQNKGIYGEALNFYLKAISLGQQSAILYNDVGVVSEQLGRADQAEAYYLQALKLDENYLPAYSNLGYLYLGQGYRDQAKGYFMERLKRSPAKDPWKEKVRKELYILDPDFKAGEIRQELEAQEQKMKALSERKARAEFVISVKRAEKHYQRGEAYRQAKAYEKAVEQYNLALNVTPDNPKILKAKEQTLYEERMDEVKKRIQMASDKLSSGEVESAKKEFQQILAIIPKESVQKSEN